MPSETRYLRVMDGLTTFPAGGPTITQAAPEGFPFNSIEAYKLRIRAFVNGAKYVLISDENLTEDTNNEIDDLYTKTMDTIDSVDPEKLKENPQCLIYRARTI